MVAILMAAVLGSGLSTLLLAKFGIVVALLAMPLAGSAAGLLAALGLAAGRSGTCGTGPPRDSPFASTVARSPDDAARGRRCVASRW